MGCGASTTPSDTEIVETSPPQAEANHSQTGDAAGPSEVEKQLESTILELSDDMSALRTATDPSTRADILKKVSCVCPNRCSTELAVVTLWLPGVSVLACGRCAASVRSLSWCCCTAHCFEKLSWQSLPLWLPGVVWLLLTLLACWGIQHG